MLLRFDNFSINTDRRELKGADGVIHVEPQVFDLLLYFAQNPNRVISKDELIEHIWKGRAISDAALNSRINSARRAIGDTGKQQALIRTIQRRGFLFAGEITTRTSDQSSRAAESKPGSMSEPPLPLLDKPSIAVLKRMVGRVETVAELSALLRSHRFVSVVGAGGMGKTTVAVAVAHTLLDDFKNAVFFVDLSTLTDAALLPFSLASALGFHAQASDPMAALLAFLGGRRLLVVLDCCEHVIDAAAAAAARLFGEAPQVHLLVTSREALRAEGERVYFLRPLETPPSGAELTAHEALASPAVQLFMERAVASGHRSPLSDHDANIVADMCRRLDGIALAIELAASRVGSYGIRGTADLLDGGIKLAWHGQRSAVSRHQTLQTMLDWSYHLLSERDRQVLCRLSVFVGQFALEAAQAVAADAQMDDLEVAGIITNLVDKSLVSTSAGDSPVLFRLLDTTRAYAATRLASSGEADQIARKHTSYYSEKLRAEAIDATTFRGGNFAAYAPHVGNVRAAIAWSFSSRGERAMAVQLIARSAPLFLGLELMSECEHWCERGLAAMDDGERGSETELALREALAVSVMYTKGNSGEVRTAIERGLELTDALGKRQHKLYLLAGLNIFMMRRGDFHGALEGTQRSLDAARDIGNDHDIAKADWMLGCTYHLLGNQEKAQHHLQLGFERASVAAPIDIDFFGNHRVRARIAFTRILWLRGFADRAASLVRQVIEEAEQRDRAATLAFCLIEACRISLWRGDFAEAAERIERISVHVAKYALAPFEAQGAALRAELEIVSGDPGIGVSLLRSALATLQAERHHIGWTTVSRALAEGLALTGDTEGAVATIDAALARADQTGGRYDVPDLLRVKGQILLSSSNGSTEPAEQVLLQSLTVAREQSALGWELRSAIALARLWAGQGRADAAQRLLLGVYQQFTEGFTTADLKTAAQLLPEWRRAGQSTSGRAGRWPRP